ncbi:thioredoxin-dependent thiol peroxidase [Oceanisphaera pacifica]|uniref:thioredoxin-dependent peroxiredoxin n=1 Tax=Oceanisphaera pacifica TaxID=2818389 RepID=A0ABS3NEU3_9GAMM|nr:thioredoxin-dependent thiol peroxidase [Oceanisphaera pacifica]MBO1519050.1 thioredoxin-dependent thiol peroxidase [Oceanisphaera pacifica]
MTYLPAGSPAPAFTLLDQNGNSVSLHDFSGKKVLVYFYPKAMTPGCKVQACSLRDSQAELAAHNVVVLGISPDPVARLKKFEEKDELNFTLLSDEDHAIADAFGVWGLKKFMGKEYDGIHRISFLIDETGTVAHVFDKFKTKDHHQVVIDYLTEAQTPSA